MVRGELKEGRGWLLLPSLDTISDNSDNSDTVRESDMCGEVI